MFLLETPFRESPVEWRSPERPAGRAPQYEPDQYRSSRPYPVFGKVKWRTKKHITFLRFCQEKNNVIYLKYAKKIQTTKQSYSPTYSDS